MKVAFSVDDLSPLHSFEHLDLLHDTLGLKFDAFIPTNHFARSLLANNLEWVDELKKREWIQPNIHGVTHLSRSLINDVREYMTYHYQDFIDSFNDAIQDFKDVGISNINGVKAPGWDVNEQEEYLKAAKTCELKYVCLNYRTYLQPKTTDYIPTFGYTHCVHEEFELDGKSDIVLHSHIHPNYGDNGLTNEMCMKIIRHLNQFDLNPVFLKEAL